MHIISFLKLREFFDKDHNSKVALQDWYKRTSKANWDNFSDIKKNFNSVDSIGNSRYVFNVKGNHYCIVAQILFIENCLNLYYQNLNIKILSLF